MGDAQSRSEPLHPDRDTATEPPVRPGRRYFVGRRVELETLYNLVRDAAMHRRARMVYVHGAAGLGKTRLVTELVSILDGSGRDVAVYRHRLTHTGGRSILGRLLRRRFDLDALALPPAEELDRVMRALRPLVTGPRLIDATRLVGSVMGVDLGADPTAATGLDPSDLRSDTYQSRAELTAINLLRYDAGLRPHVFVLDDWTRAERPDDRRQIGALVAGLAQSAAGFVMVGRLPLERPLAALPSDVPVTSVGLEPLGEPDMARLVRGLLEHVTGLDDAIVAELVGHARGNPLLAEEVVQLMEERGVIRLQQPDAPPGDGATPAEPPPPATADAPAGMPVPRVWTYRPDSTGARAAMPDDPTEAASERFQRLGRDERAMVQIAAVVGATFWPGAVVSAHRALLGLGDQGLHLAHDPTRVKVEGLLAALADRGFFQEEQESLLEGEAALRFASPAVRDAAEAAIAPQDAARYHRLAAQWLRRAQPTDRLAWLGALATHYAAGGLGDRAGQCRLEAAELADGAGRPGDALEHLRAGAAAGGDDNAEVSADLLDRLAAIQIDRGDFDEAERCLLDALHYASVVDDLARVARAHWRLGQVMHAQGQYDRARGYLEHALALYGRCEHPGGQADVLEDLGTLVWQIGEKNAFARALEHLERALRIRRGRGDDRATGRALTRTANAWFGMGRFDDAIRGYLEALGIAERLEDKRGQLAALTGLGAARSDRGQRKDALQLWARALTLAEELSDRATRSLVQLNLGEAYLESEDRDAASAALSEALALATELGLSRYVGFTETLLSRLALEQGDEAAALDHAARALEVGYAIESKPIVGHALFAQARALTRTLFVSGADGEARTRQATDGFERAIQLLDEMGERPMLARAWRAYGTFLSERGAGAAATRAFARAATLEREMKGEELDQKTIRVSQPARRGAAAPDVMPEARTIIRPPAARPESVFEARTLRVPPGTGLDQIAGARRVAPRRAAKAITQPTMDRAGETRDGSADGSQET